MKPMKIKESLIDCFVDSRKAEKDEDADFNTYYLWQYAKASYMEDGNYCFSNYSIYAANIAAIIFVIIAICIVIAAGAYCYRSR